MNTIYEIYLLDGEGEKFLYKGDNPYSLGLISVDVLYRNVQEIKKGDDFIKVKIKSRNLKGMGDNNQKSPIKITLVRI